jgi:NDP-sugar pyrophosphorylase family protein
MAAAGVCDLSVTVGFRGESVRAALADLPGSTEVRFLDVSPFDRGDAAGLAVFLQQKSEPADFLLANGDVVADLVDYEALVEEFARRGRQCACVLVDRVSRDDRASWYTVSCTPEQTIGRVEAHGESGTHRVSGLYLFPGRLARDLTRLLDGIGGEPVYFAARLGELAALGVRIAGIEARHALVHVDRCFDYMEANLLQVGACSRRIRELAGEYVYVGGAGVPDPQWIHPGTIISSGAHVVLSPGAMISPYATREEHIASARRGGHQGATIRIQGDVFLAEGARIGFCSDVAGGLHMGQGATIEDSVVLKRVVLGRGARVRRRAIVRKDSLVMAGGLVEAGADFEGVAGPRSSFMHPLTCFVCTGRECEIAAGNFFGFLRFDAAPAGLMVRGKRLVPRAPLGNATYLGDHVMTAVLVSSTPGTRIGAHAVVGPNVIASGRMEGGCAYLPRRQVLKSRLDLLRDT